jgi:hypothetical protein
VLYLSGLGGLETVNRLLYGFDLGSYYGHIRNERVNFFLPDADLGYFFVKGFKLCVLYFGFGDQCSVGENRYADRSENSPDRD